MSSYYPLPIRRAATVGELLAKNAEALESEANSCVSTGALAQITFNVQKHDDLRKQANTLRDVAAVLASGGVEPAI